MIRVVRDHPNRGDLLRRRMISVVGDHPDRGDLVSAPPLAAVASPSRVPHPAPSRTWIERCEGASRCRENCDAFLRVVMLLHARDENRIA